MTVGPGDTLDWTETPPVASEQIDCAGGAIVYSGADDLVISNVFSISAETTFSITGAGKVHFARKFLKTADEGRLVLNTSVNFGSDDSSVAAFLPENGIAFAPDAPADAAVTLTGWPSCTILPEKWSSPIPLRWANGTYVNLYGTSMFDIVDGAVTLPTATEGEKQISWRIANPANVGGDTIRIVVPSNVTCVLRRMDFNATTCSGSSWSGNREQMWSNDIQIDRGGTLQFDNPTPLKCNGAIRGEGTIHVKQNVAQVNLYGSLAGMATNSTLKLDVNSWNPSKGHNVLTRLNSSFPGKVTMGTSSPSNIVSIGFAPPDLKYETNSVYRIGALAGGSASFYNGRAEVGGSRIQYNKNQKIIIGKLTGKINVVASSAVNTCDLEIEQLASAQIYVKNGLRIRVLASSDYPEIHYSSTQLETTNAITLVNGAFINLIELPGSGKTVYLHAEDDTPCALGAVTGTGTLVVDGGTVRVGRTEPTARVEVRNGAKVTFGGGEDLDTLLGAKPALWLDAAATNAMVGAWNVGWSTSTSSGGGAHVLRHCPAISFNGASSATWTNGFPLIEKWFDHRSEQRLNFGWQDRNVNYNATLYTLVYPFLVPDGLNGRPYMSFGIHGMTDLDPNIYGLADSSDNDKVHNGQHHRRERRRMPLMQNMRADNPTKPEGHGIKVETAIMVFGSQNGGGRAILGAYSDSDSGTPALTANGRSWWIDSTHNPATGNNFGRTGSSDCYDATNGIFATKFETFVDNVSVNPTKTGLNGDWQVITVNGEGKFFRSLGMSTRFVFAGGQNYAELLVYTNKLTTTERRTVESYLAMKWNLPNAMSVKGPVSVDADSSIRGQALDVSGSGTWLIDSPDAAPTLDGTFAGTIEIPVTFRDGKPANDVRLNGTAGSARGRLTLTLPARLRSGVYPLVSGTAAAAMPWTVTVSGNAYGCTYNVAATETGISLVVGSGGSLFMIR